MPPCQSRQRLCWSNDCRETTPPLCHKLLSSRPSLSSTPFLDLQLHSESINCANRLPDYSQPSTTVLGLALSVVKSAPSLDISHRTTDLGHTQSNRQGRRKLQRMLRTGAGCAATTLYFLQPGHGLPSHITTHRQRKWHVVITNRERERAAPARFPFTNTRISKDSVVSPRHPSLGLTSSRIDGIVPESLYLPSPLADFAMLQDAEVYHCTDDYFAS